MSRFIPVFPTPPSPSTTNRYNDMKSAAVNELLRISVDEASRRNKATR
jgi:hypothetical protein